jgi:beta-glucosidase-like glycosyl hydrolase
MASHNMVDWVPMHANQPLLTGVLRERFGFGNGYVGSDNTNVEGLRDYFYFAANESDAAVMALTAGVDQDMPGGAFLALAPAIKAGAVPMAAVDRAVANILTMKFASRLFDAPSDPSLASEIDAAHHRSLSRAAAEEGTPGHRSIRSPGKTHLHVCNARPSLAQLADPSVLRCCCPIQGLCCCSTMACCRSTGTS